MSAYSSSDEYNSDEINELFTNPPRRRARITPIVPPVPHHQPPVPLPVRKSATTLSSEVLLQLAADPLHEQRTFDFKYKEMKVKPKFYVLEGAANYPAGETSVYGRNP